MSTTNRGGQILRFVRKLAGLPKKLVMLAVVALIVFLCAGLWQDWINLPLPEDAGPDELTSYDRLTLVEAVDFQCNAAVTSVFPVSAYNPGWKWWVLKGGNAYVIFDVVGDLDLCVWAEDYDLSFDETTKELVVDVKRVDARRPRIDLNPRVFNGVTYQTLQLASISEEKLADASPDRVWWEAVRNTFSGDDSTYIDELQDMLLIFGANSLLDTTCFPEALEVMEGSVQSHFDRQALVYGFEGAVVNFPTEVDIPYRPKLFEPGQTELQRLGDEQCFVVEPSPEG